MRTTLAATTPPERTFKLSAKVARHERARIRDKVRGTDALAAEIKLAVAGMRAAFYKKAGLRARESERGIDQLRRQLREAADDLKPWSLADFLAGADAIVSDELAAALKAAMAEQFDLGVSHAELELSTSFDTPPIAAKKALEDYALSFSADVADDERAALKALLQGALDDGLGYDEVSAQIADFFDAGLHRTLDDGSLRVIDTEAWSQAVARTEIARAQNSGILSSYKIAGVTTIQWLAADDERTCPICADLDGQTTALGSQFEDGIEQPPDPHTGCRCTVVAVDFGDAGGPDQGDENLDVAA